MASEGVVEKPSIGVGLRTIITVAVMIATLMEVLDTSIVNVALPDMMGNLGATIDEIGWVSTGYIISNVIILPLSGWLSGYFGRKRYLTYSIILFTAASLMCGQSHTLSELILWRVLQGAGGAAFLATAQATLLEIYPPRLQGVAQAVFGIGVIMAPTVGPTLGGIITDNYSWPWIFYINIPFGILAAYLTWIYVPDSSAEVKKRKADFIGIGLLAVGLGSLQTVLERGEREDWFTSGTIVALSIFAITGISAFVWWMLSPKNSAPAVNLRIAVNRNLAAGSLYAAALGFILYGTVFVIPQFLQNTLGRTASQAGLILFPGGLATALLLPFVGRSIGKIDERIMIGAGMATSAFGMVLFSTYVTPSMPNDPMFLPLILRGLGIGLMFVPLSIVALGTLPEHQVSEGAGLYNLFRQLGGSFGIAILATVLSRRQSFHYQRLVERTWSTEQGTFDRLQNIQRGLLTNGYNGADVTAAAQKAYSLTIFGQSYVLAYQEVFLFCGIVAAAALILLVFFQRSQAKGAILAE